MASQPSVPRSHRLSLRLRTMVWRSPLPPLSFLLPLSTPSRTHGHGQDALLVQEAHSGSGSCAHAFAGLPLLQQRRSTRRTTSR